VLLLNPDINGGIDGVLVTFGVTNGKSSAMEFAGIDNVNVFRLVIGGLLNISPVSGFSASCFRVVAFSVVGSVVSCSVEVLLLECERFNDKFFIFMFLFTVNELGFRECLGL
jgi:hypothetical protein